MAVKNFYFLSSATTDSSGPMQEDGTAPASAAMSPAQGWIAGASLGTGLYSEVRTGTERAASTFTATVVPDATLVAGPPGDTWVTPAALTGNFPAGNWTLSMSVRAVTAAYTGRGRLRFRVFKGTSRATATEITTATQITNATTANLSITTPVTLSVTWAAPAITMAGEFLFFTFAFETTAAGTTGTGQDIDLFLGATSVVTTTNFSQIIIESGVARADGVSTVAMVPTVIKKGSFTAGGAAASSIAGRKIAQANMQATGSSNALWAGGAKRTSGFGSTGQSQVTMSVNRRIAALMQIAGTGGLSAAPLKRLYASLSASGAATSVLIPRALRKAQFVSGGSTTWGAIGGSIRGAAFGSTGLSSLSLVPVRVSRGSITVAGTSGVIFVPRKVLLGGFLATGNASVVFQGRKKASANFASAGVSLVSFVPEGGPRIVLAQSVMGGVSSSIFVPRVTRFGGMNVQGQTGVTALPTRQRNTAFWTDGAAAVDMEPRKIARGYLVADGRGGVIIVVEGDAEPEIWIPTGESSHAFIVYPLSEGEVEVLPNENEAVIIHE